MLCFLNNQRTTHTLGFNELTYSLDNYIADLNGGNGGNGDNGNGGLPAISYWSLTITSHYNYSWSPYEVDLTLWASGDTLTGQFMWFTSLHNIFGTLTGQEFIGRYVTSAPWEEAIEMTFNEEFNSFEGKMWYLSQYGEPYDWYLGPISGTLKQ